MTTLSPPTPVINRPRASSGTAGMVMSSTPLSYSDLTGPRLCGGGCLRFHTWFLICEKTNETRGLGFCMLSVAVKRDRRQARGEDAGVT